ncbi:hypothetical protein PHISCL_01511 [Aspergillus sclerotialis]|uniref:Oxidoreductase n=1 Tax=Aspergillus sclerotialis TaxID=2070753 RepID=A0A3A3A9Y6_9EURO|nr:hypothetical protein PHISCL_01511 [Aspergillus sclerotialis]
MTGSAMLGAGLFAKEGEYPTSPPSLPLETDWPTAHLPALVQHKANLVAVYSRSTASAQSLVTVAAGLGVQTSNIGVYSDEQKASNQGLSDLLARSDIGSVIIALPILVQPAVVRQCLAAGKHVLCEKPIAKDVQTAVQLIKNYEKEYLPRGLVLSVAEQFRYDRAFTFARNLVSSKIGALRHIHARVWGNIQPGDNKWYETEWRKSPGFQGGFILDGGVHFVALIRYVSGLEVVQTASLFQQTYDHLPPLDTVNAGLRFNNGAAGSLSFSFASVKGNFEFIFVGAEGSVTVSGAGDAGQRVTLEDKEGKVQEEQVIDGQGVQEEVKAFLQAAGSGKAEPRAGAREALADVAVVESVCSGGGKVESFL